MKTMISYGSYRFCYAPADKYIAIKYKFSNRSDRKLVELMRTSSELIDDKGHIPEIFLNFINKTPGSIQEKEKKWSQFLEKVKITDKLYNERFCT